MTPARTPRPTRPSSRGVRCTSSARSVRAITRTCSPNPRRRYLVVDEEPFPGLSSTESRVDALGAERRVVVTHSGELHTNSSGASPRPWRRRTVNSPSSATAQRGKTTKDCGGVEAEITSITKPRWVSGSSPRHWRNRIHRTLVSTFVVDAEGRRRLEARAVRQAHPLHRPSDWSIAEIVAAYRSQWHVEADFRQMKDRQVVSFSPMFHWTDQKIRVHAFYCVLALAVARLMVREPGGQRTRHERPSTAPHARRNRGDRSALPRTIEADHEPATCSPRWTPSNSVSTTCSVSRTYTPKR